MAGNGADSEWLMVFSANKETPVFSADAIGHTPYALLVPAYSQV